MSSEEEKKKIKERYDDQVHNGDLENDHGVDQDHELLEERKGVNRKFLHFDRENELNEKHRSFRLNSYQKSKDKCTYFKASLKRFVIILVIISVICGTVYLISHLLAKRRLKTFSLVGNETHFLTFDGIDRVTIPSNELGHIHLQNVQLNPWDLLRALQGSTSLKSIKLQNIKIINGEFNDTIYLPALQDFFYDESSSSTDESNKGIRSKITLSEQKLKSILFFRNGEKGGGGGGGRQRRQSREMDNFDLTLIWTFNVNINISFDSNTVIVANHSTGELVLPWLNYLKREEIIQNAGKDLRKLHCNRLRLSIDVIPPRLTHLTLRDVKLVGGDFTSLLTKLNRLVDIRVGFPELTSLDLTELPHKTLRNLALSRFSLFTSSPGIQFKLDDGLTLISTNLTMDIVQNFTSTFKINDGEVAVSEVTIGKKKNEETQDQHHHKLNNSNTTNIEEDGHQILLRQLVQIQADRVFMYKYRKVGGELEPEQWPIIQGIVSDTSNFILERRRSGDEVPHWDFKSLEWGQWHSFRHRAMGLDKFWAHAGTIY